MPIDPERWTNNTKAAFERGDGARRLVEPSGADPGPPARCPAAAAGHDDAPAALPGGCRSRCAGRQGARAAVPPAPRRWRRGARAVARRPCGAGGRRPEPARPRRRLRVGRAPRAGAGGPDRRHQGRAAGRAAHGAGEPPRHHARPRADLPGPGQVRPRPHRGRPRGQARPGHRARRGDPAGDPGAVPAHQEQPRAHRGAGRRQDGDRRGTGEPHHRGGRARGAEGQARRRAGPRLHGGRRQVPRRVRGTPEGGAQGDHRRRGRDRHLHRRTAHDRRGRRGRGGHGRRADDQAHAGPGRAAPHRGHDARRVPQVDREGRRAGAPLPARLRGRAVGGGHHRDPARAVGALHGPPQGAHSGRRAGGGRRAVGPLRHWALPARQGDRPHRRGGVEAAHRDRFHADGARPDSRGASASSRSRSWRWRRRATRPRRSASNASSASWPSSASSATPWRRTGSRRSPPSTP